MNELWRVEHNLDYLDLPTSWASTHGTGPMEFEKALELAFEVRGRCRGNIDLTMRLVSAESGEMVDVEALETIVMPESNEIKKRV